MAQVLPFRGIVYNPEMIPDLSRITTPPYDVISPEEQDAAYRIHPYNIIRLILGRTFDADTDTNNRYTRAANDFEAWKKAGVLIRDPSLAFYFTFTRFSAGPKTLTRESLICRVRLEPFEKGVVLPHEKTFSRIKTDRFHLMKACHANFSPVFSFCSDPDGILASLGASLSRKSADMDFTDRDGCHQRLFRITAPDILNRVTKAMKDKIIFIADGHHRYETALAYRDWAAKTFPDFSADHPANFILMSLMSVEDPGLVILPAHRMLKAIPQEVRNGFLEKAETRFHITRIPYPPKDRETVFARFQERLRNGAADKTFGLVMKDRPELVLLQLKPGVMNDLFSSEMPESLRNLDVTVLTRLILMDLLGFDQARLDNEHLIAYSSAAETAVSEVLAGSCDMAFLLNPTLITQVQQIAREGLIMPRKSTYFYPKVITGQVIHPLAR